MTSTPCRSHKPDAALSLAVGRQCCAGGHHAPAVCQVAAARNARPSMGSRSACASVMPSQAPPDVIRRSIQHGRMVAAAIYAWSRTDGGHEGYMFNSADRLRATHRSRACGRPRRRPTNAPATVLGPESAVRAQQRRDLRAAAAARLFDRPNSPMYQEAHGVYDTVNNLTPEQRNRPLLGRTTPT